MSLSMHAKTRLRQRGIGEEFIDVIIDFGCQQYVHGGAEIIYLRRKERRMVRAFLGKTAFPSHYQNAYVVLDSDGMVITVGHRYRRVKLH